MRHDSTNEIETPTSVDGKFLLKIPCIVAKLN